MWERLMSGYASVRSDSEKVYRSMKESTATSGEYCLLSVLQSHERHTGNEGE